MFGVDNYIMPRKAQKGFHEEYYKVDGNSAFIL